MTNTGSTITVSMHHSLGPPRITVSVELDNGAEVWAEIQSVQIYMNGMWGTYSSRAFKQGTPIELTIEENEQAKAVIKASLVKQENQKP